MIQVAPVVSFAPGVGSGNASGGKSHWSRGGSGHRNLGSSNASFGYLLQFANWKMAIEIVDLAHLPAVYYWRWLVINVKLGLIIPAVLINPLCQKKNVILEKVVPQD